jgi:hypothetical protein
MPPAAASLSYNLPPSLQQNNSIPAQIVVYGQHAHTMPDVKTIRRGAENQKKRNYSGTRSNTGFALPKSPAGSVPELLPTLFINLWAPLKIHFSPDLAGKLNR